MSSTGISRKADRKERSARKAPVKAGKRTRAATSAAALSSLSAPAGLTTSTCSSGSSHCVGMSVHATHSQRIHIPTIRCFSCDLVIEHLCPCNYPITRLKLISIRDLLNISQGTYSHESELCQTIPLLVRSTIRTLKHTTNIVYIGSRCLNDLTSTSLYSQVLTEPRTLTDVTDSRSGAQPNSWVCFLIAA